MRKHIVGASNLFAADIIVRALNFLTVVWLAEKLAPHAYGLVVIGASVLDLALLFCDWGLKTLGARETALPAEARRFQPTQIAAARIVLTLVVFVVANALVAALVTERSQAILVHVYLLGLLPYAALVDWYRQGAGSFASITVARGAGSVVLLAGSVTLVNAPVDAVVVPWIYAVSMAVTSVAMLLGASRDRLVPRASDFGSSSSVLAASSSLGVAAFFGQSFLILPPIAAGYIVGTEDAGVVYAALRIIAIVLVVDRVFGAIYLPALARAWRDNSDRGAARLVGGFRVVAAIGIGASSLCAIFAHDLIALVYDDRYADGGLVLAIASPFVAATLINTFFAYGLIAIGQERQYLTAAIRSGALFIVVLAALTWALGLTGVALAMVLGEIAMCVFLYARFRAFANIRPLMPLIACSAVASVLVALSFAIDHTALWQAPLYAFAFVAGVLLLRGVSLSDLRATPS